MKKKNILIFIVMIIIVVVGIGGNIYMDKQKRKEEILQAEKELSSYIVRNYKGVKKISFDEVSYSVETGSWSILITLNNEDNNWLVFKFIDLKSVISEMVVRKDPNEFSINVNKDDTRTLDNVIINYGGF